MSARHRLRVLALLAVLNAARARADEGPASSPMASVTRSDIDGLVVYAKNVPGGWTQVSVTFAAGALDDPQGKSGVAHLLEHVTFTDADGSQLASATAVTAHGGTTDATTYARRTHYWIRVPAAQSRFAVEWLAKQVVGRTFNERQIEAERAIVGIELGVHPSPGSRARSLIRAVADEASDIFSDEPAPRCSRDLGLRDQAAPQTWTSLTSIRVSDLEAFFASHYVRQQAVVGVFGPVDASESVRWVAEAFSPMASGRPPDRHPAPSRAPVGGCVQWTDEGPAKVSMAWYFDGISGADRDTLYVLRNFLEHDASTLSRLTHGSAYSLDADALTIEQSSSLVVQGRVDPTRPEEVIAQIRQALEGHSSQSTDLEASRLAVATTLATGAMTPSQLAGWIASDAWDRQAYASFPDPITRAQDLSSGELAGWLTQHAALEKPSWVMTLPDPVPAHVRSLLAAAPVVLAALVLLRLLARRCRSEPSTSSQPLRWGPATTLALGLAWLGAAWLAHHVVRAGVLAITASGRASGSRGAWLALEACDASLMPLLLLLTASLVPWRVLVDDDGVTFETIAWRLIRVPWSDVRDLRPCYLVDALTMVLPWRLRLLSASLLVEGTLLRTSRGRAWFFRTGDSRVVEDLWQGHRGPGTSEQQAPPGEAPSHPP